MDTVGHMTHSRADHRRCLENMDTVGHMTRSRAEHRQCLENMDTVDHMTHSRAEHRQCLENMDTVGQCDSLQSLSQALPGKYGYSWSHDSLQG